MGTGGGGMTAVVPAGGAGTRLWPLSRSGRPKFLHDLTGAGSTLLQQTWDRLQPVAPGGVLVVTGRDHGPAVRGQLPGLPPSDLLLEPSPRDSMAAIGLAAAVIERRDPGAVLGSFAADHVVRGAEAFAAAVEEAVEVAARGDLVTIGIAPTHPATGFGYVRLGERLAGTASARRARAFVEKPDAATARAYLDTGDYRWNAGMFVVRASVLLDLLAQGHPDLAAGLRRIAAAAAGPAREAVLADVWPQLEAIAIDHAVAEPAADAGRVAVVPATFGWDDVGDWASLAHLLAGAGEGPVVLGGADDVRVHDASGGLVVPVSGRLVALLGVDDVVVVDTPDALLVTTRARAQDVRAVVERLRAEGRADLV